MSRTSTLRHRGTTYFVAPVEGRGDELLPVRFILRGPRGGSYGLLPTTDDPSRYFAVSTRGFPRRTPFDDVLFKVENDRLIVIDHAE
jgi:hypothetical protein